ncbi:FG-GAP repeat protein [Actinomadura sp. DC4]|uniref:FG-GAP repeat protein n=1 Tax=Actinomadura sp. DC4 TaxID=3055069 RepID=UPI0025B00E90|nr:FG-GAP repeat protein [Actinomadura sp. DC4]MDN3357329.1 FG-GAP repeat protein [Actinomadura sp. DC4]
MSRPRRRGGIIAVALALIVLGGNSPAAAEPTAVRAATPRTPTSTVAAFSDVNGDGVEDIVTSTTARMLPDYGRAPDVGGSVEVIPGGSHLPGAMTSLISQDSPGVPGTSQAGDAFGFALATGDFDGDGLTDVAIGAPYKDVTDPAGVLQRDAGSVTVLYGTPDFPYLESRGLSQIIQTASGLNAAPEAGDRFGLSLSTGDYDADGYADLAIGTPYEDVGSLTDAGAFYVLYGSPTNGLTVTGAQNIDGSNAGVGTAEADDHFGWSLASGDVTGDGVDDLAFTTQNEAVSGVTGAQGAVIVYPGSAAGVTETGLSTVNVSSTNTLEHLDTLTIGKFRGQANPADVVVHAGRAAGGPQADSGALVLLKGAADGISPTRVTTISQDTLVPDVSGLDRAEAGDEFGLSMAVGDLNHDGYADLATGAPGEDSGRGAASVFYGGANGIFASADFFLNEATPGVGGTRKTEEYFGRAVRILDESATSQLLVTAHREDQDYETAAAYVINLAHSGATTTVTSATRYNRDALFTDTCAESTAASCFGPGFPIAGAASGPVETSAGPNLTR